MGQFWIRKEIEPTRPGNWWWTEKILGIGVEEDGTEYAISATMHPGEESFGSNAMSWNLTTGVCTVTEEYILVRQSRRKEAQ